VAWGGLVGARGLRVGVTVVRRAGRAGGQSGGAGGVTRPGESGVVVHPACGMGGDVSVVELVGLDGVRLSR